MNMTEEIFSYRRLVVYQHSRKYVKTIYALTQTFPKEELFALTNQLRRAAISVTSNIAESMGRYSEKDKLHFIEFAFGSLYETMSQIEVAFDLEYINKEQYEDAENQVTDIAKMLSGLRASINRKL
jgi:four helix bundle protein